MRISRKFRKFIVYINLFYCSVLCHSVLYCLHLLWQSFFFLRFPKTLVHTSTILCKSHVFLFFLIIFFLIRKCILDKQFLYPIFQCIVRDKVYTYNGNLLKENPVCYCWLICNDVIPRCDLSIHIGVMKSS